ncbi:unnamed protein product [Acanthoscelides obtectus]|uniref:Uncharacterized protein n=1 Tax=Acanthoscelides obtectus TaxID=200917 RepID=A0A9P0PSH2_ACAOB|nr:unnamed protein product [Acanthoscelides obtectus]CAK1681151.1 hypothetical protein AOBTE_LOCUS33037 [Acanthoscelides obtectus]
MQHYDATPVASTSAATNFPILEEQQSAQQTLTPKPQQIEFRKNPRVEKCLFTTKDHDYLPSKTPTRQSENDEVKLLYKDTVSILHSINQNVSNIAQNVGELTEQIKVYATNLEMILQKLSQNSS